MRSIKALLFATMLFALGMGSVARAQVAKVNLYSSPEEAARAGGKMEAAGDAYIDFDGAMGSVAGFTLTYSSPVSDEGESSQATLEATAADLEKGIVKVTGVRNNTTFVSVTGVILDVSGGDPGPVTVTISGITNAPDGFAVLAGPATVNVVNEIKLGVSAKGDPGTVRTRGGVGTATLTISEGFTGAFKNATELEVEVSGIPDKATVGISPKVTMPEPGEGLMHGVPAVETSPLTGDDGEDQSAKITLTDVMPATGPDVPPTEVTLTLTLTMDSSIEELALPVDMGDIKANVTFSGDSFAKKSTPSVTIFEIRPAQCQLLFPTVAVVPAAGMNKAWDTAFGIVNPGYNGEGENGGFTFTFYGNDGTTADYSTTVDMAAGRGLDSDGTLPPGGTYTVHAREILEATGWGEMFSGHVFVLADYTDCDGIGWVTDYSTVNQAYKATVVDNDTGKN